MRDEKSISILGDWSTAKKTGVALTLDLLGITFFQDLFSWKGHGGRDGFRRIDFPAAGGRPSQRQSIDLLRSHCVGDPCGPDSPRLAGSRAESIDEPQRTSLGSERRPRGGASPT